MINKRGLSHIEIILAFIMFMSFLIFALFFFNPLESGRVLDSSLFYAMDELSDNASVNLETYSIVIDAGITDQVVGIDLDELKINIVNPEFRVEDNEGNKMDSYRDASTDIVFFNKPGNNFVIIRVSEDFVNGGPMSGQLLALENYAISSSDEIEIVSEKRFFALNESYHDNYLALKKEFNLPSRIDFAFSLIFSDNDRIVSEIEIPDSIEVVANEERLEVLRERKVAIL